MKINIEEVKQKIINGKELTEEEIKYCVWGEIANIVDEIEGDDHRWDKEMTTIIDIDGQLYAIDWRRGLTECQENSYYNQPYKVKMVEKTVVVKEYVKE